MPSFNPNYFQAIMDILQKDNNTQKSIMGMLWQCMYAVMGCIIGAVCFGSFGALFGTIIGAIIGFRNVQSYSSLLPRLQQLSEEQRQNVSNEVRNAVGSSNIDSLINYAMSGNGRQLIGGIIQRYLNGNQAPQHQQNPAGFFSRFFQ